MEVWKAVPIEGYSHYLISNEGRLKNTKRNKIHAINVDQDGYPHYMLCNNNKRKMITAHRLVAMAFIANPLNLPCVNHKDENKTNNCVDNLEWCTVKYNSNYGTAKQRTATKNSKPIAQMKNGKIIAVYKNSREAESATGVDRYKIRMCCRGERKSTGGYQWKDLKKENEYEI